MRLLSTFAFSLASSDIGFAAYSFNALEHLAGISPYFEPADPQLDPKPPQGCNVTRASYLIRHAAIWANDYDYEEYIEEFTDKVENTTVDWAKAGPLSFLSLWRTPISDADQEKLTKVGELEAFQLGVDIGQRYPTFKQPKKVWASTAERTLKSAHSFIGGLVEKTNDTKLIEVPETKEEGADSLTPHKGCPKYSASAGSKQSSLFKDLYTKPIIERFHNLAPGFNFTADDIVGMQELCGYETVIRGSSPFCSLDVFSANEWLAFEYMNDIQYHYNSGYGNEVAGAQGFPWLNATAGLLLDDSKASDAQDIHASFTHRELPPMVLVAMGLFNNSAFTGSNDVNATMPLTTQNYQRAWRSSHIIPFLANIAVERLSCESYGFDNGDYFRVVVNQSPQSIPGCADGPGETCSKGTFEDWVKTRGEMFGGYSKKCAVEYKNSTDVLSIYES